jgi:hypothetical protein
MIYMLLSGSSRLRTAPEPKMNTKNHSCGQKEGNRSGLKQRMYVCCTIYTRIPPCCVALVCLVLQAGSPRKPAFSLTSCVQGVSFLRTFGAFVRSIHTYSQLQSLCFWECALQSVILVYHCIDSVHISCQPLVRPHCRPLEIRAHLLRALRGPFPSSRMF